MNKIDMLAVANQAEQIAFLAVEKAFIARTDSPEVVDYDSHWIAVAANGFTIADALRARALK